MPRSYDQSNTASASLLRRLGAILYDTFIVIALCFAVTAIWLYFVDTEYAAGAAFQSTLFITIFGFFGLFWTRTGQTIGMMAWRIRIQSSEGTSISWMQALIRFMCATFSAGAFGLGYLWMLVNNEKLTLQDKISNTVVVYLPKK